MADYTSNKTVTSQIINRTLISLKRLVQCHHRQNEKVLVQVKLTGHLSSLESSVGYTY